MSCFFVFFVCFALFIDLLTDKVQPLSRHARSFELRKTTAFQVLVVSSAVGRKSQREALFERVMHELQDVLQIDLTTVAAQMADDAGGTEEDLCGKIRTYLADRKRKEVEELARLEALRVQLQRKEEARRQQEEGGLSASSSFFRRSFVVLLFFPILVAFCQQRLIVDCILFVQIRKNESDWPTSASNRRRSAKTHCGGNGPNVNNDVSGRRRHG